MPRTKIAILFIILAFSLQGCMGCGATGGDDPNPNPAPPSNDDVTITSTAVIYTASDGNDLEIFMADAATGETKQLTNNETNDQNAISLPDASLVAYNCDDGADREICLVDTKSGQTHQLTNDSASNRIFAWMGDGRYLLTFRGRVNDTLARYERFDLREGGRKTFDLQAIVGTDALITIVGRSFGSNRMLTIGPTISSGTHLLVRRFDEDPMRAVSTYGLVDVADASYRELIAAPRSRPEWIDDERIVVATGPFSAEKSDVTLFDTAGNQETIAESVEDWSACARYPRLRALGSEREHLITDKIVALIDGGATLRIYDTLNEASTDVPFEGTSQRNEVHCNGGDRVVIVRDAEILMIDTADATQTSWTPPADFARTAELSPDGHYLAYHTDVEELEPLRILNLTDGSFSPTIGVAGRFSGSVHPNSAYSFTTDERFYQYDSVRDVATAAEVEPGWDYVITLSRGPGAIVATGDTTDEHLEIRPFDGGDPITLVGAIPHAMDRYFTTTIAQWVQASGELIEPEGLTPSTQTPKPTISDPMVSCSQQTGMMSSWGSMNGMEMEVYLAEVGQECTGSFYVSSRNASANIAVAMGSAGTESIPAGLTSIPECEVMDFSTTETTPAPWYTGGTTLACSIAITPNSAHTGEHNIRLTARDLDNNTSAYHSFWLVVEEAE